MFHGDKVRDGRPGVRESDRKVGLAHDCNTDSNSIQSSAFDHLLRPGRIYSRIRVFFATIEIDLVRRATWPNGPSWWMEGNMARRKARSPTATGTCQVGSAKNSPD
jgi:hypothetical protein